MYRTFAVTFPAAVAAAILVQAPVMLALGGPGTLVTFLSVVLGLAGATFAVVSVGAAATRKVRAVRATQVMQPA